MAGVYFCPLSTDDQGRRVAAGVYFVRLDAEGKRLNRKVVMTR